MGRWAKRTAAEPRGALNRAYFAPKATFFYAIPRFFASRFPSPSPNT